MALAVMTYHYVTWTVGSQDSSTVLARLGIYAVSLFYILSGVSLALVYKDHICTGADVADFGIRRVFRIFPLFYIVVSSALLLAWASHVIKGTPYAFPLYAALLNYSLSFGFVDPSAYLSTGAWSIGNEIVFYTVFPWLFLRAGGSRLRLYVCFAVSIVVEIGFAFHLLSPDLSIEQQWSLYIHPLNQIHLFLAGAVIGCSLKPRVDDSRPTKSILCALGCVGVFCLLPASGNQITLVTGANRLVFSACCIGLVAAVYVWNPSSHSRLVRPLAFLGEGCYSIYLLHPIVAIPMVYAFERWHLGTPAASYSAAFATTLLLSWMSFRIVEKPMIRVGQRAGMAMRRLVAERAQLRDLNQTIP